MTSTHTRPVTRLAAGAASVAALFALTGCADDAADESSEQTSASQEATMDAEASADEEVVRLDDVGDDLEASVGEELTVVGAVQDVITPDVFTLVDPTGTTLDPVLVVGADASDTLAPEQEVEVTGVVKDDFDIEQAEETLDIQLEDELLTEWRDGLFLEAQQVEPYSGEES